MGPLRKEVRFNGVIRVGPLTNRISVLITRDTRGLLLSPCTHTKGRPCEDIVRKWLSTRQNENSHQQPKSTRTLILDFKPLNGKK